MAALSPVIFVILVVSLISEVQCVIKYPARIQTKGGHSASAQVDFRDFDNYDRAFFIYEATFVMGSDTRITVRGSTAEGNRELINEKIPGEDFTRVMEQKVTKVRDAKGVHINVYISTTLKLSGGKEKYGKSSIGVRIEPSRRAAHYWDIIHQYNNNYLGENEGEICLGCENIENAAKIEPIFSTTQAPRTTSPTVASPQLLPTPANTQFVPRVAHTQVLHLVPQTQLLRPVVNAQVFQPVVDAQFVPYLPYYNSLYTDATISNFQYPQVYHFNYPFNPFCV